MSYIDDTQYYNPTFLPPDVEATLQQVGSNFAKQAGLSWDYQDRLFNYEKELDTQNRLAYTTAHDYVTNAGLTDEEFQKQFEALNGKYFDYPLNNAVGGMTADDALKNSKDGKQPKLDVYDKEKYKQAQDIVKLFTDKEGKFNENAYNKWYKEKTIDVTKYNEEALLLEMIPKPAISGFDAYDLNKKRLRYSNYKPDKLRANKWDSRAKSFYENLYYKGEVYQADGKTKIDIKNKDSWFERMSISGISGLLMDKDDKGNPILRLPKSGEDFAGRNVSTMFGLKGEDYSEEGLIKTLLYSGSSAWNGVLSGIGFVAKAPQFLAGVSYGLFGDKYSKSVYDTITTGANLFDQLQLGHTDHKTTRSWHRYIGEGVANGVGFIGGVAGVAKGAGVLASLVARGNTTAKVLGSMAKSSNSFISGRAWTVGMTLYNLDETADIFRKSAAETGNDELLKKGHLFSAIVGGTFFGLNNFLFGGQFINSKMAQGVFEKLGLKNSSKIYSEIVAKELAGVKDLLKNVHTDAGVKVIADHVGKNAVQKFGTFIHNVAKGVAIPTTPLEKMGTEALQETMEQTLIKKIPQLYNSMVENKWLGADKSWGTVNKKDAELTWEELRDSFVFGGLTRGAIGVMSGEFKNLKESAPQLATILGDEKAYEKTVKILEAEIKEAGKGIFYAKNLDVAGKQITAENQKTVRSANSHIAENALSQLQYFKKVYDNIKEHISKQVEDNDTINATSKVMFKDIWDSKMAGLTPESTQSQNMIEHMSKAKFSDLINRFVEQMPKDADETTDYKQVRTIFEKELKDLLETQDGKTEDAKRLRKDYYEGIFYASVAGKQEGGLDTNLYNDYRNRNKTIMDNHFVDIETKIQEQDAMIASKDLSTLSKAKYATKPQLDTLETHRTNLVTTTEKIANDREQFIQRNTKGVDLSIAKIKNAEQRIATLQEQAKDIEVKIDEATLNNDQKVVADLTEELNTIHEQIQEQGIISIVDDEGFLEEFSLDEFKTITNEQLKELNTTLQPTIDTYDAQEKAIIDELDTMKGTPKLINMDNLGEVGVEIYFSDMPMDFMKYIEEKLNDGFYLSSEFLPFLVEVMTYLKSKTNQIVGNKKLSPYINSFDKVTDVKGEDYSPDITPIIEPIKKVIVELQEKINELEQWAKSNDQKYYTNTFSSELQLLAKYKELLSADVFAGDTTLLDNFKIALKLYDTTLLEVIESKVDLVSVVDRKDWDDDSPLGKLLASRRQATTALTAILVNAQLEDTSLQNLQASSVSLTGGDITTDTIIKLEQTVEDNTFYEVFRLPVELRAGIVESINELSKDGAYPSLEQFVTLLQMYAFKANDKTLNDILADKVKDAGFTQPMLSTFGQPASQEPTVKATVPYLIPSHILKVNGWEGSGKTQLVVLFNQLASRTLNKFYSVSQVQVDNLNSRLDNDLTPATIIDKDTTFETDTTVVIDEHTLLSEDLHRKVIEATHTKIILLGDEGQAVVDEIGKKNMATGHYYHTIPTTLPLRLQQRGNITTFRSTNKFLRGLVESSDLRGSTPIDALNELKEGLERGIVVDADDKKGIQIVTNEIEFNRLKEEGVKAGGLEIKSIDDVFTNQGREVETVFINLNVESAEELMQMVYSKYGSNRENPIPMLELNATQRLLRAYLSAIGRGTKKVVIYSSPNSIIPFKQSPNANIIELSSLSGFRLKISEPANKFTAIQTSTKTKEEVAKDGITKIFNRMGITSGFTVGDIDVTSKTITVTLDGITDSFILNLNDDYTFRDAVNSITPARVIPSDTNGEFTNRELLDTISGNYNTLLINGSYYKFNENGVFEQVVNTSATVDIDLDINKKPTTVKVNSKGKPKIVTNIPEFVEELNKNENETFNCD